MRNSRILAIVLTLAVTLVSSSAFADRSDDALNRLFKAMNMEKTQDQTINAMVDAQAEANAQIKSIKPEFLAFMKKHLGWKALEPEMRTLYKKSFTADELVKLSEFYETPTGKKSLEVLPKLLSEASMIGQKKVRDNMPQFLESVKGKIKQ